MVGRSDNLDEILARSGRLPVETSSNNSDHPDDATLIALKSGELDGDDLAQVEIHLAACNPCLKRLVRSGSLPKEGPAPLSSDKIDALEMLPIAKNDPKPKPSQKPEGQVVSLWRRSLVVLAPLAVAAALILVVSRSFVPSVNEVIALEISGVDRVRGTAPAGEQTVLRPGQDLKVSVKLLRESSIATTILDGNGRVVAPIQVFIPPAGRDSFVVTRSDVAGLLVGRPGNYHLIVLVGATIQEPILQSIVREGGVEEIRTRAKAQHIVVRESSFRFDQRGL